MSVLKWKILLEDECGDSFVSDRTIIDCAAYWLFRELKGLWNPDESLMKGELKGRIKGVRYIF